VNHQRLLAGAVFGYVFEIEALRQVEVELDVESCHRRPMASTSLMSIFGVERGFTGDGLYSMFNSSARSRASGWLGSIVFRAEKTLFVFRIPGGKLGLVFVEAEGLHTASANSSSRRFVFNLVGSAEDVASSWVKPRTRSRPCITPERS